MTRPLAVLATALAAAPAAAVNYRLPLGDGSLDCGGGRCVVTAYKDQGGGQDWACQRWTYPGHSGTDIAPACSLGCPSSMPVVAAAAGRVAHVHDGEADHCGNPRPCSGGAPSGSGLGNHVIIDHGDGRFTVYGHMANGSTRHQVGAEVGCGEVIGRVGMTGRTSGPHVHFMVRLGSASGEVADPFVGPCSAPPSYWTDQGPHRGLPGASCDGSAPQPPAPAAPPPPSSNTCPHGCTANLGYCCGAGDPCGWAEDGWCDCAGQAAWDGADCQSCQSNDPDCAASAEPTTCPMGCTPNRGYCCGAGDPCGWAEDGWCDCAGQAAWDGADCAACVSDDPDCRPPSGGPIEGPCQDGFEPNDLSDAATAVPAGEAVQGGVCVDDLDWFRMDVPGHLEIELAFSHAQGDLDLEVYRGYGDFSYAGGAYSDTDDETVSLDLPPGDYLARVYGYAGASARYTFRWQAW